MRTMTTGQWWGEAMWEATFGRFVSVSKLPSSPHPSSHGEDQGDGSSCDADGGGEMTTGVMMTVTMTTLLATLER